MKENKNQKNTAVNQITEGVIWKQLLFFFFPILFGTLFQQIYNTADTVVVGRFVGKEALAAVGGSSSMIVNLIVGFFVGLCSGAAVVISQFYGAKDHKNLKKALHTSMIFCLTADCCKCNAKNSHMEDYNKHNIQKNIQKAGDDQHIKGSFGVSYCP